MRISFAFLGYFLVEACDKGVVDVPHAPQKGCFQFNFLLLAANKSEFGVYEFGGQLIYLSAEPLHLLLQQANLLLIHLFFSMLFLLQAFLKLLYAL
jgi:hypothetical protein